MDYFEHLYLVPQHIQGLTRGMNHDLEHSSQDKYETLEEYLKLYEEVGWTFEYGLDGVPYNLKLKSL